MGHSSRFRLDLAIEPLSPGNFPIFPDLLEHPPVCSLWSCSVQVPFSVHIRGHMPPKNPDRIKSRSNVFQMQHAATDASQTLLDDPGCSLCFRGIGVWTHWHRQAKPGWRFCFFKPAPQFLFRRFISSVPNKRLVGRVCSRIGRCVSQFNSSHSHS